MKNLKEILTENELIEVHSIIETVVGFTECDEVMNVILEDLGENLTLNCLNDKLSKVDVIKITEFLTAKLAIV